MGCISSKKISSINICFYMWRQKTVIIGSNWEGKSDSQWSFSILPVLSIIKVPLNHALPSTPNDCCLEKRYNAMICIFIKDGVRQLPLNREHQKSILQGKIKVTLSEAVVVDGIAFITDIGFYQHRIISLKSLIFEDVFIVFFNAYYHLL